MRAGLLERIDVMQRGHRDRRIERASRLEQREGRTIPPGPAAGSTAVTATPHRSARPRAPRARPRPRARAPVAPAARPSPTPELTSHHVRSIPADTVQHHNLRFLRCVSRPTRSTMTDTLTLHENGIETFDRSSQAVSPHPGARTRERPPRDGRVDASRRSPPSSSRSHEGSEGRQASVPTADSDPEVHILDPQLQPFVGDFACRGHVAHPVGAGCRVTGTPRHVARPAARHVATASPIAASPSVGVASTMTTQNTR